MIFNLGLVCQVEVVLTHSKGIILDRILSIRLRSWYEALLEYFAHRLAKLVADDVAIADLLVDGRVMNQGTLRRLRSLLL